MTATLDQILAAVNNLAKRMDLLLTQQDDFNTDVQVIGQAVTDLGTAATAIEAEIASLKAANPALDLKPLDDAAASLKTAVSAVAAIAPPPAPAPAPPAPSA